MEKTYKSYSGGWQVQSGYPIRFVYDGWNPVLVLTGSNETVRKYTWGLDLSGSVHGAGGIGGLLACEEPQAVGDPKRYWFMCDANGNVTQVLDATDVNSITIAAHYEYDPYGNPIPIPQPPGPGPYADLNPFRFSTKWSDEETGLGYWGYRYYSPRLGRWISRDPIGEKGGLNLHGYAHNSPLGRIDRLGLDIILTPEGCYQLCMDDCVGSGTDFEFCLSNCGNNCYPGSPGSPQPSPSPSPPPGPEPATPPVGQPSYAPLHFCSRMTGGPWRVGFGLALDGQVIAGSGLGAGLTGVFFPDSCEIGLYLVASPWIAKQPHKLYDYPIGISIGAALTGEVAYYFGAARADAKSYEGVFYGGSGSLGAPVSANIGAFYGAGWLGGNLGVGTPGASLAYTPQWYELLKKWDVPDEACCCILFGMLYSDDMFLEYAGAVYDYVGGAFDWLE